MKFVFLIFRDLENEKSQNFMLADLDCSFFISLFPFLTIFKEL